MSVAARLKAGAKRVARAAVGAVSPALLRRIQLARARKLYLNEPARGPRRLLLEPTTSCNHRCAMCGEHSSRLAKPIPARHMSFERIAKLLRELRELGTEELWLAGRGEPLLHPKVTEIVELAGSLGMQSLITTNGAPLTEELADRLCQWGLRQLSVSIDSGTPETYAEVHAAPPDDRARILGLMSRLSRMDECRPRLLASMVLSQLNFRELLMFVADAIEAGATSVFVGGMRPVPFDSVDLALREEDWAEVRDDLHSAAELASAAGVDLITDNIQPAEEPRVEAWPYANMACFIGHVFTVVDVDGDAHGCCTCQNRLGSLEEAPFQKIWRSKPYRLFRRVLREMPSTGSTPPRCECRHGCGHISENVRLQQELHFDFPASLPPSGFASRADLAEALCRHLDKSLPARERDYPFADLPDEYEDAASRLRQVGIMAHTGSTGGRWMFEPRRLVARGEFADTVGRALAASGFSQDEAESAISTSRSGSGHAAEPIMKHDMNRWLQTLAARLQ